MSDPAQRCTFESHHCSDAVAHAGGLEEHHEWPKFMGGADNQSTLLALCPNHHWRQHSLVHYLVNQHTAGTKPVRAVIVHFTPAELAAATFAVDQWVAAGAPPVTGWNVAPASPLGTGLRLDGH